MFSRVMAGSAGRLVAPPAPGNTLEHLLTDDLAHRDGPAFATVDGKAARIRFSDVDLGKAHVVKGVRAPGERAVVGQRGGGHQSVSTITKSLIPVPFARMVSFEFATPAVSRAASNIGLGTTRTSSAQGGD